MDSASWRRAVLRTLVWAGVIALSVYLWWLIGRAFFGAGAIPNF